MLAGSSLYNQRLTKSRDTKKVFFAAERSKSLKRQQSMTSQLTQQIPLLPDNSSQTFYRSYDKCGGKRVVRLGWKVVELGLQQVDLAIYCLSLLQTIDFPLKFLVPSCYQQGDVGNNIFKNIWVECQLLQLQKKDTLRWQLSMYKFCVGHMIPKVRQFIKSHMSWEYMCDPNYQDTKVINRFQQEVTRPMWIKLKEFRPVKASK